MGFTSEKLRKRLNEVPSPNCQKWRFVEHASLQKIMPSVYVIKPTSAKAYSSKR
uniref:Uncharacterized protein n=1 Tax=Vibrio cholerae non-O1/non-O139 TaxID=156539 RepID=A0A220ISY4_VIBCL|nr:hypothetical protein [Vibrio cholerae non-O1/non-O139]